AYCKPCPSGVDIPGVFGMWNTAVMYDDRAGRSGWYKSGLLHEGSAADQCTRCGECLDKCPQHIMIPDRLEEAHAYLMGTA
ncbi:MAG: 4Fe-4S dicluster domain-containing protein, partial [Spirochaetota bacterium]